MSLVPMSNLLKKAQKENYAVAAFNIYNIEMIRAAIEVAEELNSRLYCNCSAEYLTVATTNT